MALQTNQVFHVDINDQNKNLPMVVKQYDKNSRMLSIVLTENNYIYTVPIGVAIQIHYMLPSGYTKYENCIIKNNIIQYELSEPFLSEYGTINAQIVLCEFDENGDISKDITLHTSTFKVIVKKSSKA